MAAHARWNNEFTEDEKCHNLMSWLKWSAWLSPCHGEEAKTQMVWSHLKNKIILQGTRTEQEGEEDRRWEQGENNIKE